MFSVSLERKSKTGVLEFLLWGSGFKKKKPLKTNEIEVVFLFEN